MTELLYVNASPRGNSSAANQAAKTFTNALSNSVEVTRLNLFEMTLPEVTLSITNAKMKLAMGLDLDEAENQGWKKSQN